ncbi:UNVERIFIED_CONTAM: hypothetical protein Scaly_2567700 [Sesamum calycinum]|uniref:Uncharacterized protein n=1 Tax=Sesamum calycinum TaxID=2727403 RepID=A0AAW2K0B1_9LAMI
MVEYYNWTSHGEDIVQDYYEAPGVPQASEEPTSTGHFEAGPSYFAFSHEGILDDGTRSCPMDVGTSSYVYGGGGPKKLVKDLGLPVEKIHAFLRYLVLTPRLQKLYSSREITEHRTWPATHQTTEGSMRYPSDAEAWKHFDRMYPDFAEEPRNVRLGLCTDGFAPHSQYSRTYSCWPVIITPYDLPPGMCMSFEYIFVMMVIPGPSNPKYLIDVYLEQFIEELLQLSHVVMRMYDHATNKAFMMRAALMWTVNDLLAYGIVSRWSTAGVMGFPTVSPCAPSIPKESFMKNRIENKVARPRLTGDQILTRVANISPVVEMLSLLPDVYGSDHKWTKKSIFWDLPYWSTFLI